MEVPASVVVVIAAVIACLIIFLVLILSQSPKLFCTDSTYIDDMIDRVNLQLSK